MKRLFILLLSFAFLVGCQAESQIPTAPETTPPQVQTLLEQGNAESENLLYIPNPHVEAMACPEIRMFESSLLLYEHTAGGMLMKRISLEDGSLLAQSTYPASPSASVQIGSGLIGLCTGNQVLLLNGALEVERTYNIPLEGDAWYLNQELETLYVFFEEGLISYDLETGKTHWFLDDATFVQPLGTKSGYVLFSYTDRTDKKTYHRCLNLSTSIVETMPIDGPIHSGVRSGDQWLLRQNVGSYVLVKQEEAFAFTQAEGLVELLPGKRQLLITDGSYRELTLYDLNGNFLSRCTLPETEYASVGTDLVWSGYWQGYFFRDTYENAAHLMFWNTGTAQEGEDLTLSALGAAKAPEPLLEKEIDQKVTELSQRFGLDIRIAEQCALDYSHYEADMLTDPYLVRDALNILELALNNYPDGFLRQLPYGQLQQIRIELVTNIQGKEQMDTHPASVGGFAQEKFDHYLIVFDSQFLGTQTVYHELSHVIDKHLEWDALLRPQALFSEGTWLSLQPAGFRYAYSYTHMPDDIAAYENSGYFISRYAMTFPTEDRATLMAQIISDKTILQENPGMAEKMRYYADCIRDCFDTAGWPETTVWEYTPSQP